MSSQPCLVIFMLEFTHAFVRMISKLLCPTVSTGDRLVSSSLTPTVSRPGRRSKCQARKSLLSAGMGEEGSREQLWREKRASLLLFEATMVV